MTSEEKQYVYGPVSSRRLGRSLGIDLVPYKACTYDCPYCQIAETTDLSLERRAFVPVETVLAQVRAALDEGGAPDWITLAGSGEPTLCLGLGDLLAGIRAMTEVPVCLITNGSLLWMPDVQDELMGLSLIVPSLDAGSEEVWRRMNRPSKGLSFEVMVDGLIAFRKRFPGEYRLEMFLLKGVNDTDDEMRRMAELAHRINPDAVDINTAVRPTAVKDATAVSRETMLRLAALIGPKATLIALNTVSAAGTQVIRDDAILHSLARHPASEVDLAKGFGVSVEVLHPVLEQLCQRGMVRIREHEGQMFFERV